MFRRFGIRQRQRHNHWSISFIVAYTHPRPLLFPGFEPLYKKFPLALKVLQTSCGDSHNSLELDPSLSLSLLPVNPFFLRNIFDGIPYLLLVAGSQGTNNYHNSVLYKFCLRVLPFSRFHFNFLTADVFQEVDVQHNVPNKLNRMYLPTEIFIETMLTCTDYNFF